MSTLNDDRMKPIGDVLELCRLTTICTVSSLDVPERINCNLNITVHRWIKLPGIWSTAAHPLAWRWIVQVVP